MNLIIHQIYLILIKFWAVNYKSISTFKNNLSDGFSFDFNTINTDSYFNDQASNIGTATSRNCSLGDEKENEFSDQKLQEDSILDFEKK
jgi:hypothetical protein